MTTTDSNSNLAALRHKMQAFINEDLAEVLAQDQEQARESSALAEKVEQEMINLHRSREQEVGALRDELNKTAAQLNTEISKLGSLAKEKASCERELGMQIEACKQQAGVSLTAARIEIGALGEKLAQAETKCRDLMLSNSKLSGELQRKRAKNIPKTTSSSSCEPKAMVIDPKQIELRAREAADREWRVKEQDHLKARHELSLVQAHLRSQLTAVQEQSIRQAADLKRGEEKLKNASALVNQLKEEARSSRAALQACQHEAKVEISKRVDENKALEGRIAKLRSSLDAKELETPEKRAGGHGLLTLSQQLRGLRVETEGAASKGGSAPHNPSDMGGREEVPPGTTAASPTESTPNTQEDSTPSEGTVQRVMHIFGREFSRAETSNILQSNRDDPMKVRSGQHKFRNYAVALDRKEAELRGGKEFVVDLIKTMGLNRYEVDLTEFQKKRYLRINFTTPADASTFFAKTLARFIRAVCQGPEANRWAPVKFPPLPSFWKGPVRDGGYWPEELQGLVAWKFDSCPKQAIDSLLSRFTQRLGCRVDDLKLFLDPCFVCKQIKKASGTTATVIKVFAHNSAVAARISTGQNGKRDPEVEASRFAVRRGCEICSQQDHTIWKCPLSKIRVRLAIPLGATLKNHIKHKFSGIQRNGGLVMIWGGRLPGLMKQTKKFGYLAFRTKGERDRAIELLSSGWLGTDVKILKPLLPIELGLLDECPTCGYSAAEPKEYGIKPHDPTKNHPCPNISPVVDGYFSIEVDDPDRNAQYPDNFSSPPASAGGSY